MKKLLLALALAIPTLVNAEVITGVYQTEPSDSGGVIHVQMAACDDDPALTCGTIIRAYSGDGTQDNEYQHLGKYMVWAMVDVGNGKWAKGKIWDPASDKTYSSKMALNGDILSVKGCIAFICRNQDWVVVP